MLVKSFILLFALGIWGVALQFGAKAAISALPPWSEVAARVLPPLVLWVTWVAVRWRASAQQQKQNEARAAEEAARHEAERIAARQRHDEELKQRRFRCDCRAVAIALAHLDEFPPADELPPNAEINVLAEDIPAPHDHAVLQRLRPAIAHALTHVFSTSPAAAILPIYVVPPDDAPGNEVLGLISAVRVELLPPESAACASPILFLPTAGSTANSVLALFENAPDLPGATILAFDSPRSRWLADEDADTIEEHRYPHQHACGMPNEGAVALLVTHPDLPRMIDAVSGLEPAAFGPDAMTPFWQRTPPPEGHAAVLVHMETEQRTGLGALPVLGSIHRATFVEAKPGRAGTLEMTRIFQGLLESAQIDAGLIDKPFTLDDAPADDTSEKSRQPQCGRLVHNAGNAGNSGKRLAALGSAMLYFDIDFSPVDSDVATNVVNCIGDLGCASSAAQLALNVLHAANSNMPALSAEFSDREDVAISIVMPASPLARLPQEADV